MTKFMFLMTLLVALFAISNANPDTPNVFCYYDSRSYVRETQAKMLPQDLDPALSFCTHLVYGYAGIDASTHKMVSLNPGLDLDQGHGNYRVITQLKRRFPALKVLLSVGGGADKEDSPDKYNALLEAPEHRTAFINSATVILKNYGFDGLDLAWEFPLIKPKKIRGTFSSIWHGIKKTFSSKLVDDKWEEHRDEFSKLVLETKNALKHDNLMLTATVLPNVNSSLYFDTHAIMHNLDYVILDGFDYNTPDRNPKEADYPSPLYELLERNPELNINFLATSWLKNGFPANKLILGIPTFGRAWKMDSDSAISGVPPIHIDGAAPEGPYTKTPGLLSYPEICTKLNNPTNAKGIHTYLRKVTDPSKRYGTYAFRLPDDNGENGMWVGYEDPDTAGNKAGYVRAKGLGGIAINDLSLDDFRGLCTGDKFPILRAAKYRL